MENDAGKIEKLMIMRDQGILSEQEYQNQLNAILKKSTGGVFNFKILGVLFILIVIFGGGYFAYYNYLFDKNKAIVGKWEVDPNDIFRKKVGFNETYEFSVDNKVSITLSDEYDRNVERTVGYFINEDKVIIAEPFNTNAMSFWFINKDVIATSFNYQQMPVTVKFKRKE